MNGYILGHFARPPRQVQQLHFSTSVCTLHTVPSLQSNQKSRPPSNLLGKSGQFEGSLKGSEGSGSVSYEASGVGFARCVYHSVSFISSQGQVSPTPPPSGNTHGAVNELSWAQSHSPHSGLPRTTASRASNPLITFAD